MPKYLCWQISWLFGLFVVCTCTGAQEIPHPAPASQTLANFNAESPRPKFTDYPVKTIYRGNPAAPVITNEYRTFRTRIREGAKSDVEFAGHYTLPSWGCGTGCGAYVIVDSMSGKVYRGVGFNAIYSRGDDHGEDDTFLDEKLVEFHPDSRLLKVNACENEKNCGFYDYVMVEGKGLKLIRRELLPAKYQPPPLYLQSFLQAYLGEDAKSNPPDYFAVAVPLRDDGALQVIVYLAGTGWCGSGGCTTLILEPHDFDYTVTTRITITWLPIRVLNTKTNGWHDIAVWVQGGGILPGYEAKLSFDGKTYPTNPTAPPAQRENGEIAGKVVIPKSAAGKPLYP
jgi:hypothetical protein